MDLRLRSVLVLMGLSVIANVCSGAYRGGSYRSYRSYRSSGSSATTSDGGFIAGMVIVGLVGAAFIVFLIILFLKKKGLICASPKVTSTPSSTINTVDKRFNQTDNYTTGFVNPPPPPTYSDVYPPSYSNVNVSASDPAYPTTATVSQ